MADGTGQLCIHSDDVDGSTTFVDSSSSGHSITANGDVHHETDQAKFGASSIHFDGAGDYLSLGADDDWNFGSGDLTIDFWLYAAANSDERDGVICINNGSSDIELHIGLGTTSWGSAGNTICLSINYAGGWSTDQAGSVNVCDSAWHHVAVVRNGNAWKTYIDGTEDISITDSSALGSGTLLIGAHITTGRYLAAYLDEIRIVKGEAVWTSDFTPPTDTYTETVTAATSGGLGLGDSMEADTPYRETLDGAGLGDSMEANVEFGVEIEDGVGAGETPSRSKEVEGTISDGIALGDTVSAFNWTDWIERNLSGAVKRFYLTLTGDADGTTDLNLPMSGFQARRRSGAPTYLEAVIPNIDDYAADIAARSNGDLVVELAYLLDGEEVVRETLITVDLENIDLDEGGRSQATVLRGHRTESFVANAVTLSGVSYVAQRYGTMHARTAIPDPYLQPGDTVTADGNTFTADIVTYIVTPTTQVLEVQEAAA